MQMRSLLPYSLVLFALLTTVVLPAQTPAPVLTLDEAIRIGLESHFGIRIARKNLQIADNNNSYGAAGYYPLIQATAGQTNNLNNTQQLFFDGREINQDGAYSNNLQAGVALNWAFFDGFRMQAVKRRNELLVAVTQNELRIQTETLLSDVIKQYFLIIQQEKLIDLTAQNLQISNQRMSLAKSRESIGSGSGIAVMQANIDLNNDSLLYEQQQLQKKAFINQLYLLLETEQPMATEIDTTPDWIRDIDYEMLRSQARSANAAVAAARLNRQITAEDVREAKSLQYPTLNLNAGLNFNLSRNQAGFLLQSVNYGPMLGVGAVYNIYDGGNIRRNIENARIRGDIAQDQVQRVQTSTGWQMENLVTQHAGLLQLIAAQNRNILIAEENLQVALERFRLGAITDLEFREIQLTTTQSYFQKYQLELQQKQLEVDLLLLSGQLVQDSNSGR